VKSREGWRKADQVKKLKIIMTFVAVALCVSVAAGSVMLWIQVKHPFDRAVPTTNTHVSSAVPASSKGDKLPVYEDSYNLIVVNNEKPLKPEFTLSLDKYEGVTVDVRIIPALKKMMQDAQSDGCELKLKSGYVDAGEQDKRYQALVQKLMKEQHYSQVRAENQAQTTVGRGGCNENQTGMAVVFTAPGLAENADFTATPQYKWLIKNSINYGFILRYPQNKSGTTGIDFQPGHFRYVGNDNAVKMREYSMCLEEYAAYIRKQAAG
jgi:D-alanyl-D-alanine carboxypeptidase